MNTDTKSVFICVNPWQKNIGLWYTDHGKQNFKFSFSKLFNRSVPCTDRK